LEYGAEEHECQAPSSLSSGYSSLLRAAEARDYEQVKLLMEHAGVKPNPRNSSGKKPLCFVVERGNHEMVEFLMMHGADPNECQDSDSNE
jgi:ankyrin repeat protein